jgi:hypothetical protein
MLNALKKVLVRSTQAFARGFVWWFEKLGENPSLSRDPGIVAWQLLAARGRREEEAELPAGEVVEKSSDDDDGKGQRRPLMRRAAGGLVRRASLRRSRGALHQPAFVAARIANRRALRSPYRWDLGA